MSKIYLGNTQIFNSYLGNIYSNIEQGLLYDSNAEEFFAATGISNTALKTAVNSFVLSMKSASLWDKMNVIYPFVTDSTDQNTIVNQLKYNLVNTSLYTGSIFNNASVSFGYGGLTTNSGSLTAATATYMDTGYVVSNETGLSGSFHISVYTNSPASTNNVIDMGAFQSSPTRRTYMQIGTVLFNGNATKLAYMRGVIQANSSGSADKAGLYVGTYDLTGSNSIYTNLFSSGSSIASTGTQSSDTVSTLPLAIGCARIGASVTNVTSFTGKTYQYSSMGEFLTPAEVASYNTIVYKLQSDVDAIFGTSRFVS